MQKNVKLMAIMAVLSTSLFINSKSFAGGGVTSSANLKITLQEVMTLEVTNGTSEINLVYDNADHYKNGVNKKQDDHLKITSTAGFVISVRSSGDLVNGTSSIPISTISLEASKGTSGSVGNPGNISGLSTSDASFITSDVGTIEGLYNVKYISSGGAEYINKNYGDYQAEIIYTIVAK